MTAIQTTVPLSVLDLSPIPSGRPASQALHDTVALAKATESYGYQRFWLAEHHNIGSVASSAPMVMIATVAAATSTIRVGSGGIMLPNHAPLAVAESFRVLEGLHPGRIDLGLGRAPGTDQLTAYALRRGRVDGDEFPQQFSELLAYVDGFPDEHPFKPLRAIPDDVPLPPLWILGSSLYGGRAAAAFGTGFAFAGHFGSADPAGGGGGLPGRLRAVRPDVRAARDPRGRGDRLRQRGARRGPGPGQRPRHGAADAEPARPGADGRGGGGARLDRAGAGPGRPATAVHVRGHARSRSATTWSGGAPTPTRTSS